MKGKTPEKASGKQKPIRFTPEDVVKLDEMQQRLGQDASVVVRWALRYYYRIVSENDWMVTSLGDVIYKRIDVTPPPDTPAEAPQEAPPLARRVSPR